MEAIALCIPVWYIVFPMTTWDGSFCSVYEEVAKVLICLVHIGGVRRWKVSHGSVGEKAEVFPVGLVEIPALHWLTRYRCNEFCCSDERRSVLGPREFA